MDKNSQNAKVQTKQMVTGISLVKAPVKASLFEIILFIPKISIRVQICILIFFLQKSNHLSEKLSNLSTFFQVLRCLIKT